MNQQQANKDYVIQSLINQVAELSYKVAERDAVITEQHEELLKYREDEIAEMDAEKE